MFIEIIIIIFFFSVIYRLEVIMIETKGNID